MNRGKLRRGSQFCRHALVRRAAVLLASLLLIAPGLRFGSATLPLTPPSLPTNFGGGLLSFSQLTLDPGTSGTLTATVTDPSDVAGWTNATTGGSLELQLYRFAYEGTTENLSSDDAWAPTLAGGSFVNETLPALALGASTNFNLNVVAPSSASAGSYYLRVWVELLAGGTTFTLASRGTFSDAVWAAATLTNCTSGSPCTPTLNLSKLGVSGVVPETGIAIVNPSVAWALYGVLAASLLLAGAGAYVAFRPRRGSSEGGSSSGATSAPRRTKAASALGKSRTKEGD